VSQGHVGRRGEVRYPDSTGLKRTHTTVRNGLESKRKKKKTKNSTQPPQS